MALPRLGPKGGKGELAGHRGVNLPMFLSYASRGVFQASGIVLGGMVEALRFELTKTRVYAHWRLFLSSSEQRSLQLLLGPFRRVA
mmetsp:Transcript_4039/g.14327  ORF Transcript_4039/g.14327 Transcript_4039/m.14327 type:complete len:86 (+) Transcript_4039:1198-1455(+)